MSASIVDKKHIDLMVGAITEGTRDSIYRPGPAFRQIHKNKLGQLLVAECVKSVSYRYPQFDFAMGELPGPDDAYYMKPYIYEDCGYRPTAPELLKAIGCYGYQSREHPEWSTSDANKFCEAVIEEICRASDVARAFFACQDIRHGAAWQEYDDAPWEFDAESIADCAAKVVPTAIVQA